MNFGNNLRKLGYKPCNYGFAKPLLSRNPQWETVESEAKHRERNHPWTTAGSKFSQVHHPQIRRKILNQDSDSPLVKEGHGPTDSSKGHRLDQSPLR